MSFMVKTWSFTKIRLHLTLKLKTDSSIDFFTAICRRGMKLDEKQTLSERKAKSRLHHGLGSFTAIYIKGLELYWRTLVAWSYEQALSQIISLLLIGKPWILTKDSVITIPTNTRRVFHVETTWKRSFLCRFYVEYMWYIYRDLRLNIRLKT